MLPIALVIAHYPAPYQPAHMMHARCAPLWKRVLRCRDGIPFVGIRVRQAVPLGALYLSIRAPPRSHLGVRWWVGSLTDYFSRCPSRGMSGGWVMMYSSTGMWLPIYNSIQYWYVHVVHTRVLEYTCTRGRIAYSSTIKLPQKHLGNTHACA